MSSLTFQVEGGPFELAQCRARAATIDPSMGWEEKALIHGYRVKLTGHLDSLVKFKKEVP